MKLFSFGGRKEKPMATIPVKPTVPAKAAAPAARPVPADAANRTRPAQPAPQKTASPAPLPQVVAEPSRAGQAQGRFRELTDNAKQELIKENWTLMTGKGRVIDASEAGMKYAALLRMEKGNLFVVAKGFQAHPEVSPMRYAMRKRGVTVHNEVVADMATIQAIYEKDNARNPNPISTGVGGNGAAAMQTEFIKLLDIGARSGSSDIHIIVNKFVAVIKIRTDGVMVKLGEMLAGQALELCNAVFNMTETSEATYKPLDYQQARITESSLKGLKFPPGVQAVRLQFNPYAAGGRYLVARLLYEQKVGSTADIDTLGYTRNQIADIKKMRRKTIGINIICGPTGSGKSTTLQRCLTAMSRERPGINGITIEDPPEYIIEGWVQLPVVSAITAEERTKNFALAMNAVLRDDPDAIMIGEIRDIISANLAYSAAETGHGVWASLHANSAMGVLDRLRDLGIEVFKLCDASKFTGLVSQRLVRKINPDYSCGFEEAKQHGLVAPEVFDILEKLAGDRIGDIRFAATHRVEDPNLAYKGRSVAAETVLLDQKYLDLYREGKKVEALEYWKAQLNGMDMLEHGLALILMGQADVRSVEDVVGLIEDIDPTRVPRILELVGL